MHKNISIVGDGGMGTVLGVLLCEKGSYTRIWGYDREQLSDIDRDRENKKFLPGYKLPDALEFEPDDERIMAGVDLIVSAVPCQFTRSVWSRLSSHVPAGVPIVSVTKGIENGTLLRPTEIIAEILGSREKHGARKNDGRETSDEGRGVHHPLSAMHRSTLAVLSGPTIADELARRLPATACVAGTNEELSEEIQATFSVPWFRVYTNTDMVGVELAGARKNIIAIAAGIIDGTGAGDNAKAALLTRGLAEISRLGIAMGARPQTFSGLTGLGDLVTTCISPSGRNRAFGQRIGEGQTVEQARNATESVVEGVATCQSVIELAGKCDVEMPITRAIHEVLFENKPVQAAIADLMTRRLKAEN
jgi:glycerol-3-phosphate dehydrogenase (NAD(P)+)